MFLKRTTINKRDGGTVGQYCFGDPCGKADEVRADKAGGVDLSLPNVKQRVAGIRCVEAYRDFALECVQCFGGACRGGRGVSA